MRRCRTQAESGPCLVEHFRKRSPQALGEQFAEVGELE
jgi:hypothetical protein